MTCINICNLNLVLPYQLLTTGTYFVEIISSLKERYFATLTFTVGDDFTMSMPPLNESGTFKVIITDATGEIEKILYFSTYPYAWVLA
jgi:hypothetical protein